MHLENIIHTFPTRNSLYLQCLWKQAEPLSLPPSQMGAPAGACADIWLCKLHVKHHGKSLLDKCPPQPATGQTSINKHQPRAAQCNELWQRAAVLGGFSPAMPPCRAAEVEGTLLLQNQFIRTDNRHRQQSSISAPVSQPWEFQDALGSHPACLKPGTNCDRRCKALVVAWLLCRGFEPPPQTQLFKKHHLSNDARSRLPSAGLGICSPATSLSCQGCASPSREGPQAWGQELWSGVGRSQGPSRA